MKKPLILTCFLFNLMGLSACNDNSSDNNLTDSGTPLAITCGNQSTADTQNNNELRTGHLSPLVISGLQYKTETQAGITDEMGAFNFKLGETISFSLGQIQIGETVPVGDKMTPRNASTCYEPPLLKLTYF